MKVIVSVFNNLLTDQRVEKVCRTLHENGYEVILIGNSWEGLPQMERPYPYYRIKLKSKKLRFAYLEFQQKLFKELLKHADKNTILLANDLDTLQPNVRLARKLKIPVIYDSHEIFTEQPSVEGRFVQKIWRYLESRLLKEVKYMMTESFSYAEWFKKKYDVEPVVVRNIPRKITEAISFADNPKKIILYQGALNQSRGIPQAIRAMHGVENAVFQIIGDGPQRADYEKVAKEENLKDKVQFLGKMKPEELRKFTRKADVGIAVEENGGISYFYSLPNKVADYIQSKVPVVMINFPEMKRVYVEYKVGEMIENHDPKTISAAINTILKNGRNYYKKELDKAALSLCWENEEPKILTLFKKVETENFH